MFEVEPSQGHKPRIPQIPQREHLRERPTKVGPHFAQEPTHPTTGPKNAQETPLQPLHPRSAPPTVTSPSWHTKSSRSQQRLVIQGRGPTSLGRLPRHCLHSAHCVPMTSSCTPANWFPITCALVPCSRAPGLAIHDVSPAPCSARTPSALLSIAAPRDVQSGSRAETELRQGPGHHRRKDRGTWISRRMLRKS